MNQDQVFIDAIQSCKKQIDRPFISQIILKDKTNTIKKYLNSFGITQLAYLLQKLATEMYPGKSLLVAIDDRTDKNQRRAQRKPSKKEDEYSYIKPHVYGSTIYGNHTTNQPTFTAIFTGTTEHITFAPISNEPPQTDFIEHALIDDGFYEEDEEEF